MARMIDIRPKDAFSLRLIDEHNHEGMGRDFRAGMQAADMQGVPTTVEGKIKFAAIMESAVERNFPRLFRFFYPRIYPNAPKCGNYGSAKKVALYLVQNTWQHGNDFSQKLYQAEVLKQQMVASQNDMVFMASNRWARQQCPMLWVGRDMAEAIMMTTPPLAIDWSTFDFPFPSMALMVPLGLIDHPDDGSVVSIFFCHFPDYDALIFCAVMQSGEAFQWSFYDQDKIIDLVNLEEQHEIFFQKTLPGRITYGGSDPFANEGEREAEKKLHIACMRFVFGSLLIQAERSDLVTPAALIKKIQHKQDGAKEFWTPQVLGLGYKIKRETTAPVGTHSSPRLHWVRGFYREQVHGPGRTLRKTKWIEPFTRGE